MNSPMRNTLVVTLVKSLFPTLLCSLLQPTPLAQYSPLDP